MKERERKKKDAIEQKERAFRLVSTVSF